MVDKKKLFALHRTPLKKVTNWERIFANHVSDKRLVARIFYFIFIQE